MNAEADSPPTSSALPDYRRYWVALYRRDVATAMEIVDHWLRRCRPQRLYLRLFTPALTYSGTLFAEGRIGYRDEHFVTHHTLHFMRRVRRRFVQPDPTGPLALATGVGQESHVIGLRMACDFLQHDNWRIGWYPSNDRATVRDMTLALRPAAVLLSIGLDEGLGLGRRLTDELRRGGFRGLVVVGGGAIDREPSRAAAAVGADFAAANGLDLVRKIRVRSASGTSAPDETGRA